MRRLAPALKDGASHAKLVIGPERPSPELPRGARALAIRVAERRLAEIEAEAATRAARLAAELEALNV